jgi:hypothetical protein
MNLSTPVQTRLIRRLALLTRVLLQAAGFRRGAGAG